MPLVLASRSPQRTAILHQLGIEHEVLAVDVEEIAAGDPVEAVRANALAKAEAAAAMRPGRTILGVDTEVVLDGEILGKPPSPAAARDSLRRLSGRSHEVISGLAVIREGNTHVVHEATEVTFRSLGDELVEEYVKTGEWRGRAGGYAIQEQGASLVRRIMGDYLNVVGLPVGALLDLDLRVILRDK